MAKLSSLRGNADIKCNPSSYYDMNYEGHYVFVSLLLLPPPRLTTFSATASVRGRRPRILVATARASLSLSLSLCPWERMREHSQIAMNTRVAYQMRKR